LLLQISQAFKPDHDDVEYAQGKYMLRTLGLQVRDGTGHNLREVDKQWEATGSTAATSSWCATIGNAVRQTWILLASSQW
jgi:hypothetical protein